MVNNVGEGGFFSGLGDWLKTGGDVYLKKLQIDKDTKIGEADAEASRPAPVYNITNTPISDAEPKISAPGPNIKAVLPYLLMAGVGIVLFKVIK